MDALFGTVRQFDFVSGSSSWDDDFYDRVNHWWTSVVIIMCAVIISAKQYVGAPIQCWMPQQFPGAWAQYAENYCWVQNTYFVPHYSPLPHDKGVRYENQISYYQWVPYVLALQALLFYMPHMLWRTFNWNSGVNVQSLVTKACDAGSVDPSSRKDTVTVLSRYIEDSIMMIDESKNNFGMKIKRMLLCICGTRRTGNYLTLLYLFIKLLYIANIVGQFFLLNQFLGTNYTFYGFEMLRDLTNGREWTESGHFPRVTMCDFSIRTLGNRHNYTIQCVLMINLFNEKIFIFLWFWFFIVGIVTVLSLFYWMYRMMINGQRQRFVKHFLKISKTYDNRRQEDLFRNFVNNRLRTDGILLLHLVNQNAGDIVTTDLITDLWERYKETTIAPQLKGNENEEVTV